MTSPPPQQPSSSPPPSPETSTYIYDPASIAFLAIFLLLCIAVSLRRCFQKEQALLRRQARDLQRRGIDRSTRNQVEAADARADSEAFDAELTARKDLTHREQAARDELASIAGEGGASELYQPLPFKPKVHQGKQLSLVVSDRAHLPVGARACFAPAQAPAPADVSMCTPAGFVAASAMSDVTEVSGEQMVEEFDDDYSRMMRRNAWNHFRDPDFEDLFRSYLMSLWGERLRSWCILGALVAGVGVANLELDRHAFGVLDGEYSLRVPFITFLVGMVLCWLAASRIPRPWLARFYRWQQLILSCTAVFMAVLLCLSGWYILALPLEVGNQGSAQGAPYAQGHWNALVGATCIGLLAWSDLDPMIFALCSLLFVPAWAGRSIMVHSRVVNENSRDLSSMHRALWSGIIHYTSIVIVGIFVSFHKDRLNRQNFVMLQLMKAFKDRRIQTLHGEKRHLEILVDVAESAVAVAAKPTHIKFVDKEGRGSSQDMKGEHSKHSPTTGRVRRARMRRQGDQTESMAAATGAEGRKPSTTANLLMCTDSDMAGPSCSKSAPGPARSSATCTMTCTSSCRSNVRATGDPVDTDV